jgi:flagellar protein FliO/FliZ
MNNILMSSSWESFIQLLGALVIFAFVLVITYLATRWMGGMQKTRGSNKNLRIIETIGVGNNKYISIVEVGTVYLVVSVGKDEVHLLTEISKEELKDLSFEDEKNMDLQDTFAGILKKVKDKVPKKQDKV